MKKELTKLLNCVPFWLKAIVMFVIFPLVILGAIIWAMTSCFFKKKNTRPISY